VASANFCPITSVIAGRCAVPVLNVAVGSVVLDAWQPTSARVDWVWLNPATFAQLPSPLPRQISPGKNTMFPRTSAAFTVGAVPSSFAVMCQLASAPSAFYAISVRPPRGFPLGITSHFCSSASSKQALASLPLPSASGYPRSYASGFPPSCGLRRPIKLNVSAP
jgi:hypothetical protein